MPAPKRQQGEARSKHDEAVDDYIASLEGRADANDQRIADLEAALRPFAAAYLAMQATGQAIGARHCDVQDFARAAELVKD